MRLTLSEEAELEASEKSFRISLQERSNTLLECAETVYSFAEGYTDIEGHQVRDALDKIIDLATLLRLNFSPQREES